jgi:hypothetical protein
VSDESFHAPNNQANTYRGRYGNAKGRLNFVQVHTQRFLLQAELRTSMLIHDYHSFYFRKEQFPLKHYKQIISCVNSLSKLLKVTYYNNATNVSDCFHAINFLPRSRLQNIYIRQSAGR